MKLQDVILKAMARKLTWIQAAEIAGMSVRNMQRMRQRYQEDGYTGLFDHRRGKRSIHRVPMEKAEKVLALYRDRYADFNVRHFHEKLKRDGGHPTQLQLGEAGPARRGPGGPATQTGAASPAKAAPAVAGNAAAHRRQQAPLVPG